MPSPPRKRTDHLLPQGKRMSSDVAESIDEINMQFIKRVRGDKCGRMDSRFAYLRNIHPTYTIIATIEERTTLESGPTARRFDVELPPNRDLNYDVPHALDVHLGCPVPGPTLQLFEWIVVNARLK